MRLMAVALREVGIPLDERIEYIETVYMFDEGEQTRLCEATPSFYLHPLYVNVVCREGVSDAMRENLEMDGWADVGDPTYLHCRYIEPLIGTDRCVEADHSLDDPADSPTEVWESWQEYWQGNNPL